MANSQQSLLKQIIADPHSTQAECEAAQRKLNALTGQTVSQSLIDHELEAYWSPNPDLRCSDRLAARANYSTATQTLLADIGATILGLPSTLGAVERLTALVEKTASSVVRSYATSAVKAIAYYQQSGRLTCL
jgi:hypothetical protein